MRVQKHRVDLTPEERQKLETLVRKRGKGLSTQKRRRANILLKADRNGPGWTDVQIAEVFGCSEQTVYKVRKRFAAGARLAVLGPTQKQSSSSHTRPRTSTQKQERDIDRNLKRDPLPKREFEKLSTTVEQVILNIVDKKEISQIVETLPEAMSTDLLHVCGVFHRLDRPFYAILAGRTNAGKTSVARQIFSDMAVNFRYKDEVLKVDDLPDVTVAPARIPFGRNEIADTDRFTLFDTPGLTADDPELSNTARVALGLPQEKQPQITTLPVNRLGTPDENDIADITEDVRLPLDAVDAYFNRDILTCIYVLKASETPFEEENIEDQIASLRRIYQDRFLIVVTHEDAIKKWPTRQRERRYEQIQKVTGGQYTPVNGLTGDGVIPFAREFLINVNKYSALDLAAHLKVEYRSKNLFYASRQLSDILLAAFFSKELQKQPDELLYPALELVTDIAITTIYKDKIDAELINREAPWKEESEKSIRAGAKEIEKKYIAQKVEYKRVERHPVGWWEGVKASLSDWKPTIRKKIETVVIKDRVHLLAHLYYLLYNHIYSRENILEEKYDPKIQGNVLEKAAGTALTGKRVPKKTGINWFIAEFRPYTELIQNRENAWDFYSKVGPVLERFWQEHHPEVLPVLRSSDHTE